MYDTREKAARDHQWLISGARSEGIEKGAIIGTIRTCQSILGLTELSVKELSTKSLDELRALAIQHQSAIRGRIA